MQRRGPAASRRGTARPAGLLAAALSAAALLAACGGGGGSGSASSGSASLSSTTIRPTSTTGGVQVFDLTGTTQDAFSAATLEARPGTVRIVLHVDPGGPHNVTFDALGGAHTPDVDPGTTGSVTVTVPQPGVYTFSCTIHPGMRAALHVG